MGERQEVLALLQAAAQQVLGESAPPLTEDVLLAEAEIDSLDLVEIVMAVEEAEGYLIDAADLENAAAVRDLVDVLLTKRSLSQ